MAFTISYWGIPALEFVKFLNFYFSPNPYSLSFSTSFNNVLLHQPQTCWIFGFAPVLDSLVKYTLSNVTTVVLHQTFIHPNVDFFFLVLCQTMSKYSLTFSLLISHIMIPWHTTQYQSDCNFSFWPYTKLIPHLVQQLI